MILFQNQSESYQNEVLDQSNTFKISIEASKPVWLEKYCWKNGITFGLSTFGKSAPYKDIYKLFNLTSDEIVKIQNQG